MSCRGFNGLNKIQNTKKSFLVPVRCGRGCGKRKAELALHWLWVELGIHPPLCDPRSQESVSQTLIGP